MALSRWRFGFSQGFVIRATRSAVSSDWNFPYLQGLELANPTFMQYSRFDFLLGAEEFAHLLLGEVIRANVAESIAMISTLGWLITDSMPDSKPFQ